MIYCFFQFVCPAFNHIFNIILHIQFICIFLTKPNVPMGTTEVCYTGVSYLIYINTKFNRTGTWTSCCMIQFSILTPLINLFFLSATFRVNKGPFHFAWNNTSNYLLTYFTSFPCIEQFLIISVRNVIKYRPQSKVYFVWCSLESVRAVTAWHLPIMTQEKYNTLHEFWHGAFLCSYPLYLFLSPLCPWPPRSMQK